MGAPAGQVFGNRVLLWCRKFKLWFVYINNWTQVLIRDNLSGKSKIKGTLVFLSKQFCLHCAAWKIRLHNGGVVWIFGFSKSKSEHAAIRLKVFFFSSALIISMGELLHPFLSGLAAFFCNVVAPVSCARYFSGCQWERLLHLRRLRYNACHVSCFLNFEPLSNSNLFFLIQWSFSLERMRRNTHPLSAWFKPWGKYSGCCSAVFVKQHTRAKCLDRTSNNKITNNLCSK